MSSTPRPTRSPDYWTSLYYRAQQSEIGIRIDINEGEAHSGIRLIDSHRPSDPIFADYNACIPDIPNVIFLVKPGVTLD